MRLRELPLAPIAFLVLGAALVLGGCIEYEDQLTVNRDGSAEHRVVLGRSLEFESMFDDIAPEAEVEGPEEDLAADMQGEGVELLSERTYSESRRNAQGEEVEYEFQEVVARYDNLVASPYFADNTGDVQFEATQSGYRFRRVLRQEAMADDSQDSAEAAQSAEFMRMLFPEAKLTFVVEMPTQVTNARLEGALGSLTPQVNGRQVTVKIPFVEAMMASENMVMEIESR